MIPTYKPSKLGARIHLQLALQLARDLQKSRTTDPARFSRMVDGKGKSVMNENDAIITIHHVIKLACAHYPVACRWLERWMTQQQGLN